MAIITRFARPELWLRVKSAAVLIIVSLSLAYAGSSTFAALILFFATLMAWEWGRVVRAREIDAILALQVVATVIAGVLTLSNYPALAAGVIIVATYAAFWLHRRMGVQSDPWWSAAGVYYAGFPAVSLIAIREDPQYGFLAIVYLFLIVWSADIGAFFTGKLLGGPKLAPRLSPNKTWAGLAGGALFACAAGIAFALWFGHTSVAALGCLSLSLALASQAGDLGESAVKRFFGVKNSSGLIPGHGGVLDRLDGLVFAAISAGLVAVVTDPMKPGRALLIW